MPKYNVKITQSEVWSKQYETIITLTEAEVKGKTREQIEEIVNDKAVARVDYHLHRKFVIPFESLEKEVKVIFDQCDEQDDTEVDITKIRE